MPHFVSAYIILRVALAWLVACTRGAREYLRVIGLERAESRRIRCRESVFWSLFGVLEVKDDQVRKLSCQLSRNLRDSLENIGYVPPLFRIPPSADRNVQCTSQLDCTIVGVAPKFRARVRVTAKCGTGSRNCNFCTCFWPLANCVSDPRKPRKFSTSIIFTRHQTESGSRL